MTDHNIVQAAREALTRAMPLITPGARRPMHAELISAVIDLTTHLRALADHLEAGRQEKPAGSIDPDVQAALDRIGAWAPDAVVTIRAALLSGQPAQARQALDALAYTFLPADDGPQWEADRQTVKAALHQVWRGWVSA